VDCRLLVSYLLVNRLALAGAPNAARRKVAVVSGLPRTTAPILPITHVFGRVESTDFIALESGSCEGGFQRVFGRGLCRTAATFNRYKALVSLCYKQGIINNNLNSNPARLIPQRKESPGRLRYLSREEYDKLQKVIQKRFPEHVAEFIVSAHTGMRLSEQYTIDWSQMHPDRRAIDLDKTKSGSVRTVHLNLDALGAIETMRRPGQKRTDRVFPREDRKDPTDRKQERFDNRSWFETCVTEAGIPRITWHGLRHTFCSWLAMAGATTREIMEAAGHKTMSQAARYSHLSPQHTQSVVDRIAGKGTDQPNMHQNMHQPTKGKKKAKTRENGELA
jgi:integrase